MYMIDLFLGGQFSRYGLDVIRFSEWDSALRYDPMIRVFPRLTKCTFHVFGPSGDIERYDALCLLPLNIVNEKIFIVLWFWFYFLAMITFFCLIYRITTILIPRVRYLSTTVRYQSDDSSLFSLCKICSIGDWFVLHLLSKNLDRVHFNDITDNLWMRIKDKSQIQALEMKQG